MIRWRRCVLTGRWRSVGVASSILSTPRAQGPGPRWAPPARRGIPVRCTGQPSGSPRSVSCRFLRRVDFVADEPVGDVDMCLQVFRRCVLLQEGADGDAQLRVLGQLGGPVLEAVDIGEGDDLTTLQHQRPVVDTGLATGGQPEVLVYQPKQMIAVFSDPTSATGLLGCSSRRCSPKRHWESSQSAGSWPDCFIREWAQVMRLGTSGFLEKQRQ